MPGPEIDLDELLPHRRPMRLVDKVLELDLDHAVALAQVAAHWPGLGPQGLAAEVLVELMAQTAGVHNGWERFCREGCGSDRRGWLVGIKSARFEPTPIPLGTLLTIHAANQYAFEGFREVAGRVLLEGRSVAEAELQLLRAG